MLHSCRFLAVGDCLSFLQEEGKSPVVKRSCENSEVFTLFFWIFKTVTKVILNFSANSCSAALLHLLDTWVFTSKQVLSEFCLTCMFYTSKRTELHLFCLLLWQTGGTELQSAVSDLDLLTSQPHPQLNIKLWQEYINRAVMYSSLCQCHWGSLVGSFSVICSLKDEDVCVSQMP